MTRPLNLNDLRAIRELQSQGLELDLERARLWPHSALTAAIAARLPFNEIGAWTFILYPNQSQQPRALGLVQARLRWNHTEADITFIAPALDAHPDAVTIWYRLLAETTNALGEEGVQRIFVQVGAGNGVEEVLHQAGFAVYAHEDIYCLAAEGLAGLRPSEPPRRLRRQRKRDTWNLLRLYTLTTPRHVQQAEGMVTSDGKMGKLGEWWEQALGTGYVLESADVLVGAARLTRGRAAHWLRLYVHPQAQASAEALLFEALSLLNATRARPVYCSVRDYEGGLRGVLEAAGFEHELKQSLMVKHTTVRVKEAVPWLAPALEKPAPVARVNSRSAEWEAEPELLTL